MSLGNFTIGSTIRLPLQITESGIPVSDATNVKVFKIIKPNKDDDGSFPKAMTSVEGYDGIYYYDYIPQNVGNYIVIYNFDIDSATFSAMDSFYMSASGLQAAPRATAVSNANFYAKSISSSSSSAKSVSGSDISATEVSGDDPYAKGL